jgi:phosphatidylglycerophosphate synthase
MKRVLKWLRWNLANILSASRILTPVILFGSWDLSIREKIAGVIFLAATDLFDGFLARKIGNEKGIGRVIDSLSDKILIFSTLVFLLWEKIIDPRITGVIILGEALPFSIACFGVGLAWSKNQNRDFSQTTEIVLEHWKINAPGKLALAFYFLMSIMVALSVFFSQNGMWIYFYFISFLGGLIFRVISVGYYISDLNNWQKEYNKTL